MKPLIFVIIGALFANLAYADFVCPNFSITCKRKSIQWVPDITSTALAKSLPEYPALISSPATIWEKGNKILSGGDIKCRTAVYFGEGFTGFTIVIDEKLGVCTNSDTGRFNVTMSCFQTTLNQKFRIFDMWGTGLQEVATCEVIQN